MGNKMVPEIRFAGYRGEWKQKRLGNLADFSKGNGYSKSDLTDKGTPVILYGRLYTKYETIINSVDTFTKVKDQSILSKGNEVIVPASGESPADIARASVVPNAGIILGGDINIVKPNNQINPVFLALSISHGKQQIQLSRRAQGKSIVHLRNADLKTVELSFPGLDEQTKISNFFMQLDSTIAVQQREIEYIKQTKQGFLQKMFPKAGESVPEIRVPEFKEDWTEIKLGEICAVKTGPFGSTF